MFRFFVFLSLVCFVSRGNSANISFDNGSGSLSWHDPTNWNPNTLPAFNDAALILSSQSANVVIGELVGETGALAKDVDVRQNGTLNLFDGGQLTFNRWLWVGWLTPGTVNQFGGTVIGQGNNTDIVIDRFGIYNQIDGGVVIQDDLELLAGAEFNLAGSAVLQIGDDLRVRGDSSFSIKLDGNVAPGIAIGDDLRLGNGQLTLQINATGWTGEQNVRLFDVGGSVTGDFASVVVNGTTIDPSLYSFQDGQVFVQVTEPKTSLMALSSIFALAMFWSKNGRKLSCRSASIILGTSEHDQVCLR